MCRYLTFGSNDSIFGHDRACQEGHAELHETEYKHQEVRQIFTKGEEMYQNSVISKIEISQLGEQQEIVFVAKSINHLFGPDPVSRRLAWLLGMCFSMHDRDRMISYLSSFGWNIRKDDIHQEGFSQQLSWENSEG